MRWHAPLGHSGDSSEGLKGSLLHQVRTYLALRAREQEAKDSNELGQELINGGVYLHARHDRCKRARTRDIVRMVRIVRIFRIVRFVP
jgi:hypothetical protein